MAALLFVVLPCLLLVPSVCQVTKCPTSELSPPRSDCKRYLYETGARRFMPLRRFIVANEHNIMCADVMRINCGATIYLKTKYRNGQRMVKMRMVYESHRYRIQRKYYFYMTPVNASQLLGYHEESLDYTEVPSPNPTHPI